MRIEQGVKVLGHQESVKDIASNEIAIKETYIKDQYILVKGKRCYAVISSKHKNVIKIAKMLNEDLKRGDV